MPPGRSGGVAPSAVAGAGAGACAAGGSGCRRALGREARRRRTGVGLVFALEAEVRLAVRRLEAVGDRADGELHHEPVRQRGAPRGGGERERAEQREDDEPRRRADRQREEAKVEEDDAADVVHERRRHRLRGDPRRQRGGRNHNLTRRAVLRGVAREAREVRRADEGAVALRRLPILLVVEVGTDRNPCYRRRQRQRLSVAAVDTRLVPAERVRGAAHRVVQREGAQHELVRAVRGAEDGGAVLELEPALGEAVGQPRAHQV